MATKSTRDSMLQRLFDEQYGKGVITPDDLRLGTAHVASKLRGLEVKSLPEQHPAVTEAQSKALANVSGLVLQMAETQDDFDNRVKSVEEKVEGVITQLTKTVEALTVEVKGLRKQVNAGPRRADRDAGTQVQGEQAQEVKRQLDEAAGGSFNPLWGDMQVPKG